ncbi:MAG: 2-hydroxy-6-oxo-2-4-heptadienoate hydrolase [Verrucomicrobia bacterium]|nr:MAG: 2-hydroxy-6-oxo-2-4-heptadienoate hydrolase [Verrucomicrobiota bacterium]
MRWRTWSEDCLVDRMLTLRFAFSIGLFATVVCPSLQGKEAISKADKFVTVYGARIHYVEAGRGVPLILIHGLADDTTIWDPVIPRLAARFRVIALDQIGFGRSDKPLLNYRISTFVDFLHGFMSELKIERASLIGNSLGSWVAAAYALEHPERIERLVLSDAAGYAALVKTMDARAMSALRLASREDIRYLGALTFRDARFYRDIDAIFKQRMTAGDNYTVGQFLESMVRGDDVLDNRLRMINRPTLVIWGRDDKLIPLSFGERFHQEIANSQLQIIDNCGHMPQLECPTEFSAAVLQFFGDTR